MLASRTAVLGRRGGAPLRRVGDLARPRQPRVISRRETLLLATFVVALYSARRIHLALLTLRANHKASLALPLLPASSAGTTHRRRRSAAPPPTPSSASSTSRRPTTRRCRRAALGELRARWVVRWPRAASSPPPSAARSATPSRSTVSPRARRRRDRRRRRRPSGGGPSDGRASPSAAVATAEAVRALTADNIARLKSVSQKEAVAFQLSGSEALMAAARLARVNTGKPLIITFGGGAHGWGDGVAAEGLALGEERYACDVLTLTEQCETTAHVLYHRRDEIAAVIVNPLAGVLADADAAEGGAKKGGGGGGRRVAAAAARRRATAAVCRSCSTSRVRLPAGARRRAGALRRRRRRRVLRQGARRRPPLGALCGPAWLLQTRSPTCRSAPPSASREATASSATRR